MFYLYGAFLKDWGSRLPSDNMESGKSMEAHFFRISDLHPARLQVASSCEIAPLKSRASATIFMLLVLSVSMGAHSRSANFIVQTGDQRLADQIAKAAEKYRHDLAVEWLGKPMPNWSAPCVMNVRVGPSLGAGGATTFAFDRGEVYSWRMDIQGSVQRLFDSVLPHEITHMIFASHFRQPLPRWADEGGATSVEHISERTKYRKMLVRFLKTGRGISFNRMFAMEEYPTDVMPLYAQGFSLAEFLIQSRGRRKYVQFLGDGLRTANWSEAIRLHYNVDNLGMLQNNWVSWVRKGWPELTPQAAGPPPEMLASAGGRGNLSNPHKLVPLTVSEEPFRAYEPAKKWQPTGNRVAATSPTTNSTEPIHTRSAHPQPIERSRQIILEWQRPSTMCIKSSTTNKRN